MTSIGSRKPTHSRYVKLKGSVSIIHLGEEDSDLLIKKNPVTLWINLVWSKVSTDVKIKDFFQYSWLALRRAFSC